MITFLSLAAILVLAMNGQVFPSFLTRLGGNALQQGLLLTSLFFFYPLSSIAAGTLADHFGKRRVVAAGLGLCALPFALSAALPSLDARILAVLLFGLGGGVVESQVSALLSDAHPSRGRSILNLSQTLYSAGAAGGPFLIALLFSVPTGISLPTLLWAFAALTFLICFSFFFTGKDQTGGAGTNLRESVAGYRTLIRSRILLALALAVFLYVAAEMGTALWLAKYGELYLRLSPAMAPVCITIFWAGLGVSRGLVGALANRISDSALLSISILLTLAAQLFTFSVSHPVAAMIGIGLIGLGMGAVWPTLVALAGARFREVSGTAIGIIVAAGGIAVPLTQLAVGFLSRAQALGLRFTLLSLSAFTLLDYLLVSFTLSSKRVRA